MSGGPAPSRRNNAAQIAEQSRRAYELRLTGLSLAAIGQEMGLAASTVHSRIEMHIAERVNPLADQLRVIELDRLDKATAKAFEVLNAEHVVCQQGKIVRHPDGTPVRDSAPVLAAIDRLVRLSGRRSKLLGLDAPTPVKADVTVHQVDPMDTALARLLKDAQARNEAEEARLRGEAPGGALSDGDGAEGSR